MLRMSWEEELQDELVCPICLESFKDPVILKCGHNYCQACINKCWGASGMGVCPQCRKSLLKGEQRPNKPLEEAVDIARDLEGACKKHQEVFSLFCKKDRTLICMVCRESREHRDHTVVPIAAAAEEYKEQILSHLSRFQRVREERGRQVAAEEGKYQTVLEKTECQKQEIVSEFKQECQIWKQAEQLLRNCLEGTIQDLVKTRNKNTKGLLLLDNQIAELNQKCQQPGIEFLKDIDSTLSRCEQVKGEEQTPVESLTELESRVQALSESQKVLRDLLKNFKVELAPELGPLENISSDVKGQVSGEDPTEEVPDNPEQDDTSVCLLDCEEGKHSSDSCKEQEVVLTDEQNNLTDFIKAEPEEALGHWFGSKVRRRAWKIVAAVEAALLLAVLIAVIVCSVSKSSVTPPDSPAACCPENWIGYHGKCYLFSADEADWTLSQHFCSSSGASLAWLDTLQEKDFLMQHKGNLDPWIGVSKEPGQPWKWTNGSVFNNLVQIGGGGDCAYIYEITVSSSTCDTKRNWICSKPDEFAKRKIA
ncbi:E3 ubiquitin-protein ligase TRIM39-like [Mauremys reevesii]|uniref:E3 ubiquitin-protein ligase TRIM39-like n=1 Tax=Mauremys reevesii TaxID=260615 RepID=UPI00193F0D5D|nr:E3 ubiquitin-protein ligase TRIM39-like [Mauremys reevesii]